MKTRPSFIEILKEDFKDPAIKQKCCLSSQNKLIDYPGRLFDDFPTLLSFDELDELINQFKIIIKNINYLDIHDEFAGMRPAERLRQSDKHAIYQLEIALIQKGRAELLDEHTQIKKELIELLGWEKYQTKIDRCAIIAAYVGAIHQQMAVQLSSDVLSERPPISAFLDYIKSYSDWVHQEISPTLLQQVIAIPQKRPTLTVLLGTGLLTLGSVLLFFNSHRSEVKEKENEENTEENIKKSSL